MGEIRARQGRLQPSEPTVDAISRKSKDSQAAICYEIPFMPVAVSFPWDAQLVVIRREAVPRARWGKAAQARMYFARLQGTVTVDQAVWVSGFAQGAPYRRDATGRMAG